MAAEALQAVGARDLALDLNVPPLAGAVAAHLGFSEAAAAELRTALDRKDVAAVNALAGSHADLFRGLLRSAGPAETAIAHLRALNLPAVVQREVDRLDTVQAGIREVMPDLTVTVDPVEHRGFEYQSGVSFALYASGVHGELGRGGRYRVNGAQAAASGEGEPATGFTLFMDTVMRALPPATPPERAYLPYGTTASAGHALREAGWVTVAGLAPEADPAAEARRLGCGYWLRDGDLAKASDQD
jgi:ATP phosphoribosyltransferase regulatory subunit